MSDRSGASLGEAAAPNWGEAAASAVPQPVGDVERGAEVAAAEEGGVDNEEAGLNQGVEEGLAEQGKVTVNPLFGHVRVAFSNVA